MTFSWSLFIDLGLISVALLIATFLRSRVGFGVYALFSVVAYSLLGGRRSFAKLTRVWYQG